MSVTEDLQIARAMLSVLDQHIKALRQPSQFQFNEIPSARNGFIYKWSPFDLPSTRVQTRILNIDEDAAFVAESVMVLRPDSSLAVDLALSDGFTGRALTSGQSSTLNPNNNISGAFFPNGLGLQLAPYVWFDLPAAFLIPRAGSLVATVQGLADSELTIALAGYKVFQE